MVNLGAVATGVILSLLAIVLVVLLVNALAPSLLAALGNLSASGLPLASLFATGGVVAIIVVTFVIIGVIKLGGRLGK